MSVKAEVSGVYCAAVTPVREDRSPDLPLFATHCERLIEHGCNGVALLGTTGEANSFGIIERQEILEYVVNSGIAPEKLMPGTGTCAIADTVALTRHALSLGVSRVVMLPPFYYKKPTDDGLFSAYSEVIERIGNDRLKIVLYHIPQMSSVPITASLVERLIKAYPQTVVGIKDSAGDLENMKSMVDAFPGFSVLAGADPLLLPLMEHGGAGCITATSNLVSNELAAVFRGARDVGQRAIVAAAQEKIVAYRTLSNSLGAQIPTIKAMLGFSTGETGWKYTRPPLIGLTDHQRSVLGDAMAPLQTGEE
ncbi:dihydrodipicolinate synthase family protein [Devosia algicola]|uniref:Dihydrodipicolinate synthase family protein n=1 Tax=Devosia algicola TaxID=3026418 RepID=A0ABY7YLV2_9HYPH|nr:dihydrodipicolinate synthase family protein [Devosia algicola]WDR02177.1 dihydrodipicolinate synthase family protein [Devosia algicola]